MDKSIGQGLTKDETSSSAQKSKKSLLNMEKQKLKEEQERLPRDAPTELRREQQRLPRDAPTELREEQQRLPRDAPT